MIKPNFQDCQQCPQWDDINGCWSNCKFVCEDGRLDEEGNYIEEFGGDEDEQ